MSSELLVDYGEDAATAQLGQLKLSTIEDQQWPPDDSTLSKSGETMLSNYYCLKEPSNVLQETFKIFLLQPQMLHTKTYSSTFSFLIYFCDSFFRDRPLPAIWCRITAPSLGPPLLWHRQTSNYWSGGSVGLSFLYISSATASHLLQSQKCLWHDKYTVAQKIGNIFLQWKWSVFVHNPLCVSRWW